FHIPIKVRREIDLARIAMNICLDVFQREPAFLWTTTQRTKQVPLKIQQPNSCRAQANFEHESPRLVPFVSKLVRSNARDFEIVAALQKLSQTLADRKLLIRRLSRFEIRDQFLLERTEALQI